MNTELNSATQDSIESSVQNKTPRSQKKKPRIQTIQTCSECEFTAKTRLLIKKHMILKHPDKITK